ncbi:mCG1043245, partial [Mus musculus]
WTVQHKNHKQVTNVRKEKREEGKKEKREGKRRLKERNLFRVLEFYSNFIDFLLSFVFKNYFNFYARTSASQDEMCIRFLNFLF